MTSYLNNDVTKTYIKPATAGSLNLKKQSNNKSQKLVSVLFEGKDYNKILQNLNEKKITLSDVSSVGKAVYQFLLEGTIQDNPEALNTLNILSKKNNFICQEKLIQIFRSHIEQVSGEPINIPGLCRGLSLLYLYYQFTNRENDFFDGIESILKSDRKSRKKMKSFCNDCLFLQNTFDCFLTQSNSVRALQTVSERLEIKNMISLFNFSSYFQYDKKNNTFPFLIETLSEILKEMPEKQKGILISGYDHVITIFYKSGYCFFYDSNDIIRLQPFSFDLQNRQKTLEALVFNIDFAFRGQLIKMKNNEKKPLSLSLEVLMTDSEKGTLSDFSMIKKKLEKSLYPKATLSMPLSKNFVGKQPIHMAAQIGSSQIISMIKKNPDLIDIHDKKYPTPLTLAVLNEQLSTIRILHENGSNLNVYSSFGRTPLMHATYQNKIGSLKTLIELGVDVNEKNKEGLTALILAARNNKITPMQILIAAKAKIDLSDDEGSTPLIHAIKYGKLQAVKALIRFGADIHKTDNHNCSPLEHAALEGHVDIYLELIRCGAKENKEIRVKMMTGLQQKLERAYRKRILHIQEKISQLKRERFRS